MSDKLTIEIRDSKGNPKCSLMWRWGGSAFSMYVAELSEAIGTLNDDSSQEEIAKRVMEVFQGIGVPRNKEWYMCDGLGESEYELNTKFADTHGIPDGSTSREGAMLFTPKGIKAFSEWALTLVYLELGNVTPSDCFWETCVEDEYGLYDWEEGSEYYDDIKEDVETAKNEAYPIDKSLMTEPIKTKEQRDWLIHLVENWEWLTDGEVYYHRECE